VPIAALSMLRIVANNAPTFGPGLKLVQLVGDEFAIFIRDAFPGGQSTLRSAILSDYSNDMASAFGGGSSQAAFGARSGATVLSRATAICAILFIVGALALGILGRRGPGSVLGGRAPLAQPSTPNTTSPAKAPVPPGVPSVPPKK